MNKSGQTVNLAALTASPLVASSAAFFAAKSALLRRLLLCSALATVGIASTALTSQAVQAQNMFAPRIWVNDQVITEYEISQRAQFLRLLRSPGNPDELALSGLIDDRLRMSEAKRFDVKLPPEDLNNAMSEFAGRANLTTEAFVAELAKAGIAPETFRDFVHAGAVWRAIVRGRFAGRISVSDAEIDRALEGTSRSNALKLQVSELVMVLEPGHEQEVLATANRLSQTIKTESGFAAAARQYSQSPTAPAGGRVTDWLPTANLPPALSQQLLALAPGGVSAPVMVPGAVVLFQLRDVAPDTSAPRVDVAVSWADFLIPEGSDMIERVAAGVNTCNDLYGLAEGLPPEMLTVHPSQSISAIPADIGYELAKLDTGEFSTALSRDGYRRLIMLCSRNAKMEEAPNRTNVRDSLQNQKLEGMAEAYLEELRAAAQIRRP